MSFLTINCPISPWDWFGLGLVIGGCLVAIAWILYHQLKDMETRFKR
jgi:hypothetical protein